MAVKKRQVNTHAIYFVTFTCYKWLPLFDITRLEDHIYSWFEYLHNKNIKITGYVIMPNHIHLLIYLPPESVELMTIIGNAKRFMAYEIVKRLQRHSDILTLLEKGVKPNEKKKDKHHQVFQDSYDAKECYTDDFIVQKLNYIHKNPVSGKWNLARTYLDYPHSSARFYEFTEKKQGVPTVHFKDL